MYLIQFLDEAGRTTPGIVESGFIYPLKTDADLYTLAIQSIEQQTTLSKVIASLKRLAAIDYETFLYAQRILPPITHQDPSRILVSGTGLTHLNSVMMRKDMHKMDSVTDAQRIYYDGLMGGKPAENETGAMPEWFFKGFGCQVRTSNQSLSIPKYALDGGEEAELAVIYIVGNDCVPYRLGFALGNEFSDHVLEKKNHYYLAHSKLRECSIGTEIYVGDMPNKINGFISIQRDRNEIWRKKYVTGPEQMTHSLQNIENHVFKYDMFCKPGQVHIFFLGADEVSFKDEIK